MMKTILKPNLLDLSRCFLATCWEEKTLLRYCRGPPPILHSAYPQAQSPARGPSALKAQMPNAHSNYVLPNPLRHSRARAVPNQARISRAAHAHALDRNKMQCLHEYFVDISSLFPRRLIRRRAEFINESQRNFVDSHLMPKYRELRLQ